MSKPKPVFDNETVVRIIKHDKAVNADNKLPDYDMYIYTDKIDDPDINEEDLAIILNVPHGPNPDMTVIYYPKEDTYSLIRELKRPTKYTKGFAKGYHYLHVNPIKRRGICLPYPQLPNATYNLLQDWITEYE